MAIGYCITSLQRQKTIYTSPLLGIVVCCWEFSEWNDTGHVTVETTLVIGKIVLPRFDGGNVVFKLFQYDHHGDTHNKNKRWPSITL